MQAESVAAFAGLLADRSRASVCLALLDGRAWTVGELARHACVGPSTMSEHLSVLVDAGLLAQERQGRHRYVRLAGPGVAELVEDLAAVAGVPVPIQSLRGTRSHAELAAGRTCYDHLAGQLGVQLFDCMVRRALLDTRVGLVLTGAGSAWLARLGCDLDPRPSRRPLLRTCLDWTERRHHLGGRVGASLHTVLLSHGWTTRGTRPRAVRLTDAGRGALAEQLGWQLG